MISEQALIVGSTLTLNRPLCDITESRLYEIAESFHGASLLSIANNNDDDSLWFSYLSDTCQNVASDKRKKLYSNRCDRTKFSNLMWIGSDRN